MPALAGFARVIHRGLPLHYSEPAGSPGGEIELGTCVLVSLSSRGEMIEEGVVIEIVLPDQEVQSARVGNVRIRLADEERYVVQTWSRRVLRHASDLVVVTP